MHPVYFIGAGPGEADQLTLRGADRLARCGAVFAPVPYEMTFARQLEGKTVMVPFDYSFEELRRRVETLREESPVGFLVPGDQTFFSPFQALIDSLGEDAEIVPGVGIANAASARLRRTLDLPGACSHAVITSPRILAEGGGPSLRELAGPGATLLLYMNTLPLGELVDELRAGYGRSVPIALLHRLGLPGEEIVTGTLDDIVERVGSRDLFGLDDNGKKPALTLVIAGDSLDSPVDGAWWDRKWETSWKSRRGQ